MLDVELGRVKWFGGLNRRTNKQNDFGFLERLSGEDLHLHKNELVGTESAVEGQVYIFRVDERNGRLFAAEAKLLSASHIPNVELFKKLISLETAEKLASNRVLGEAVLEELFKRLLSSSSEELQPVHAEVWGWAAAEYVYLANDCRVLGRLGSSWKTAFDKVVPSEVFKAGNVPLKYFPPQVLADREEEIAAHFDGLSLPAAKAYALQNLAYLSAHLLFFLCMKNVISTREELGTRFAIVERLVVEMYRNKEKVLPAYIKTQQLGLKQRGGYRSSLVLWGVIEPLQLKLYLFQKDARFANVYERSGALHTNIVSFTLFHLISSVGSNVGVEATIALFNYRLWEAMTTGGLDIGIQRERILELFPSCSTLRPEGLSCEAVYWEKSTPPRYLCRGRNCANPQVLPRLEKHYLDYNIYDWLAHYGVDYSQEEKPSNKDYAIKLAGYFNRLHEIYEVLKCRSCSNLMVPNLEYARTKFKEYEDGKFVEKEMAPAYRLTVFHCNEATCELCDKGYYISHCRGFGCAEIIDTRDLKVKCANDRYVCKGCGSCCEVHARAKPVGLCGCCGADLKLFQSDAANAYGKKKRWAVCGASCGFKITTESLPQKFNMPSCQPVYNEQGAIV